MAGYFEQKRGSPTGLALVVLAHAAVLGALMMIKGPTAFVDLITKTEVTLIPIRPDPPPVPEVQPEDRRPQQRPESVTVVEPPIRPPIGDGPVAQERPALPPLADPPGETIVRDPPVDPPRPPVRRLAEYDSRYARALQPPYPGREERAQQSGQVRVRVTIAANGRVAAVARLAATSEGFWQATQRQAMDHWRFRPATVDGRPVESTMVFTVHFRIEDA